MWIFGWKLLSFNLLLFPEVLWECSKALLYRSWPVWRSIWAPSLEGPGGRMFQLSPYSKLVLLLPSLTSFVFFNISLMSKIL